MVKRIRRYSTSFKVVLILLGAIAMGYFAKLFNGTKQVIAADTVAEIHPLKKHKRKHRIKSQSQITVSAFDMDTVAKAEPVKTLPAAIKPISLKPLRDSINNNNFLYITYVRPNITGIVKLRGDDKYYADIIANIPANAKVSVLKKGAMYYQVTYNNNIGFVPKWALKDK